MNSSTTERGSAAAGATTVNATPQLISPAATNFEIGILSVNILSAGIPETELRLARIPTAKPRPSM